MSTPTPPQPEKVSGRHTEFTPEAFRLMKVSPQDRPLTACASCPASIWFYKEEWRSFCNIMKFASWQGKGTPILVCSAREAAVMNLQQEYDQLAGQ
ncbi:hypothetical protein [Erythrobacter sp.]|uniref:hypothetical protein n=1 Tax=Erythrobacter sp. TaxID=1042 RepID=UPI0025FF68C9|nr:hypothetical protein [Erythrobacter sp.]